MKWTRKKLVELCITIEAVCPQFGCHVAMTGGCLYKSGKRKDGDILLYRIRQTPKIDLDGLFEALEDRGIKKVSGFGWCYKLEYEGMPIDCFVPEEKAVLFTGSPTPNVGSSGERQDIAAILEEAPFP